MNAQNKTNLSVVCRALLIALTALATMSVISHSSTAAAEKSETARTIAFYGFRLINTTIEPAGVAEFNRIRLLDEEFANWLDGSRQFKRTEVPLELIAEAKTKQPFGQCDCEADFGKKAGATLVAWGTVERVSDLILNINIYIADTATNKFVFIKSVDIRGNNDKSWLRGLRWMLKNYLINVK